MKKILRKSLKILGILVLIFLAALILVPVLFKKPILNKVKQAINDNLNAKVEFADFNLSLIKGFPYIRCELTELSVVGVDTFAGDTLIALKSFSASASLPSVLFGDEIELRSIILEEPVIHAIVLSDSTANWDIAKEDTTAVEVDTTTSSPFSMALKKFEIINGKLTYSDATLAMDMSLDSLNVSMKGDFTESTTDIDLIVHATNTHVDYEGIKYLKEATIDFNALLFANLDSSIYRFQKNTLKINELSLGFDGWVAMPEEDIDMDLTFETGETSFKSLLSLIPAIYLEGYETVKAEGSFVANGSAKGIYNDNSLPLITLAAQVKGGRFNYPDLPKSVENVSLDVFVETKDNQANTMDIDLKQFHMEMAGNPLDARMKIAMTLADIYMNGMIKGTVDLASVTQVVPVEETTLAGQITADLNFDGNLSAIENEEYDKFKASGSITAKDIQASGADIPMPVKIPEAQLDFSPASIDLATFDLLLGESDIKLRGKVENYLPYYLKNETLKGSLTLNSNNLNINEILADEDASETAEAEDTSSVTAFEIPQNIDFTFNADIKKALYDKLTIENIRGLILAKEGVLNMQQLSMNMLGGSVGMSGSYQAKNINAPHAAFDLNMKNIAIQDAFTAFNTVKRIAPIAEKCNGNISTSFGFDCTLDYYLNPVMNTLNAQGIFSSENIAIKGSPLFAKIGQTLKNDNLSNPSLRNFRADFKITNGNLVIQPFETRIGKTKTVIGGTQNLDRSINYQLGFTVPSETASGLLKNINVEKNKEVDLNVVVGGTLDKPEIKKFTSGFVEEIKEEVIEEIKNEVKEEVNNLIDEAEAKAKQLIEDARKEQERIMKQARDEADRLKKELDAKKAQLLNEAEKKGPIAVKAAKVTTDKLEKETNEKIDKILKDADEKSKARMTEAEKEADRIRNEAKTKSGN